MKAIQVFCEKYGWVMLGLAIVFSLFYSLLFHLDFSNYDYLFYIHLVDNNAFSQEPLVSGTILFSKPLWFLFGRNFWMWKFWAWVTNCITAFIPFIFLLNKSQRKQYAYVMALVILVLNWRFGLEPPKYVYLFNTIMLTCLIKYIQNYKYGLVIAISIFISLIAFVRFPSIFVCPVMILAMIFLKNNVKDILTIVFLPILLFVGFISITNGSITLYLRDLSECLHQPSSVDHTIGKIFTSEVNHIIQLLNYIIALSLPIIFFTVWQLKKSIITKISFFVVTFFVIMIGLYTIRGHHWSFNLYLSFALYFILGVFYCYANNFKKTSIIIFSTITITSLFASIGSDYGFIHCYMAIFFIPYLLINTSKKDLSYVDKYQNSTLNTFINKIHFNRIFTSIFLIVTILILIEKVHFIYRFYKPHEQTTFIDAGNIYPNFKYNYINKSYYDLLITLQKEFEEQSIDNDDVIFWGFETHVMSFANDKWPITNIWRTTSNFGDSKAFSDLKKYVNKNHPVVIDMERHSNTSNFLLAQGYSKTSKDGYDVFVPQTPQNTH